jgi:CopG family nickel-responsive transcriptional regulator
MSVKRIAVSIEPALLAKLEERVSRRVYANRSKAVSDMLRDCLCREEWASGKGGRVGTISFVYSHHARGALEKITAIQHEAGPCVKASMHVHLPRGECLEVIAVKGTSRKIRAAADAIAAVRGVTSCKLSLMK